MLAELEYCVNINLGTFRMKTDRPADIIFPQNDTCEAACQLSPINRDNVPCLYFYKINISLAVLSGMWAAPTEQETVMLTLPQMTPWS